MAFAHPTPELPLIGFALFGSPVDEQAMVEALEIDFDGVSSETVPGEAGATFVAQVDAEGVRVMIAPRVTPASDEVVRDAHPLLWQTTDPLKTHRAHVVISAFPTTPTPSRSDAVMAAMLFTAVAATLLELPDAIAVHYGSGGVTFPADMYLEGVDEALESESLPYGLWTSTWIDQHSDGTVSGRTRGLDTFGHADLVVEQAKQSPQTVFALLSSVAEEVIVNGAALNPGDTLKLDDDVLAVRDVPSAIHSREVLAIQF